MIRCFDVATIDRYGREFLDKVIKVNMRLVPEVHVTRMKSALALQIPSMEAACCHAFLGWDVAQFALQKMSCNPIDRVFDIMKGTFLKSCETVCSNPEEHFRKFTSENRCFPIKKVFEVLKEFCPNAANQLLDISLIDDLSLQIQENEMKETLLIYYIQRNKFSFINNFIRKITQQDFTILVVDFDMLFVSRNVGEDGTSEDIRQNYMKNLVDNIKGNFNSILVEKPSADRVVWEELLDTQIKSADVFVTVIPADMLNLLSKWKILLYPKNIPSLTSTLSANEDFRKFEEDRMEEQIRYQYIMYKKLYNSDKANIAIIFEEKLISEIVRFFPITFVLPKEMKKLLFMLEELRK